MDAMSELVEQEVASQLVTNMRACASAARHVTTLMLIYRVVNMVQERQQVASLTQAWMFIPLTVEALALSWRPDWISVRTNVWCYSSFMLTACLSIFGSVEEVEAHLLHSKWLLAGRVVGAWAYQRPVVVFLLNFLYTILWTCISIGMESSYSRSLVLQEFFILVMVTLISAQAYASTWANAHHVVQARTLNGEVSAMKGLLNLICDVSVELDSELKVAEPGPRLAALLNLNSGRKNVQGVTLQQYMPEQEDRQHFQDLLLASQDDHAGALPGALHATLRDSLSNLISVEICYVHFYNPAGSVRYLVGLREATDTPMAPLKKFGSKKPPRKSAVLGGVAMRQPVPSGAGDGSATPPRSAEAESLAGSASPSPSKGSDEAEQTRAEQGGGGRGPIAPFFRTTTDYAKDMLVLEAMTKWSMPVKKPLDCCQFHVAAAALHKCARRMQAKGCVSKFRPTGDGQCEGCGAISEWDEDSVDVEGGRDWCPICEANCVAKVSFKQAL